VSNRGYESVVAAERPFGAEPLQSIGDLTVKRRITQIRRTVISMIAQTTITVVSTIESLDLTIIGQRFTVVISSALVHTKSGTLSPQRSRRDQCDIA
jgi:hypothetical protein